jgi:polar amino acid transport system permease protein
MEWLTQYMVWDWLPRYAVLLSNGLRITITLLILSVVFGMVFAIPLGLVQATGPKLLALPARAFCTFIRGTPLLVQLWLMYYGFGSLFPQIPWIRESILWPLLRDGYYYALFALIISFAGYEGEVMRGAFLAVPKGELEAGKAFGMSRWGVLRRIWLPRAIRLALPTLAGETALQLQATPLAATVTVLDLFGVSNKIRQDTFRVYEPLLLVLVIYVTLYFFIVWAFRWYETRIPMKK